ncbi:MAG: hypothetical protein AB7Q16_24970 [Vicinamibacterales bacterium]
MPRGALYLLLGAWLVLTGHAQAQSANPPDCSTWQDCRDQVEQAIGSGAFEQAHDLAWRAVQRGPKDDPALMFLLARAQSLAGRPQDALVMIRRIAERGVPTEALIHPDLARMRALPGWPDVETLVARAGANETTAAATPVEKMTPETARPETPTRGLKPRRSEEPLRRSEEPRPPDAPASVALPHTERRGFSPGGAPASVAPAELAAHVDEAARFTTDRFVAAGLAYDAVSRRYLFGDRDGRKLRVVGEGLDHAVDLVRAESAGFLDVRALAIDTRRGDLWVASADAEGTSATLHKLQLISGRPLQSISFEADDEPVVPVDLAVTADGTVIVLEANGHLHRLRPGASSIETVVKMKVVGATSMAPAEEGAWFVAHEAGLSRVELATRRVVAVGSPKDISLAGFERIRAHRDGLVGIQAGADAVRRIVRLELTSRRRSVRAATTFDRPIEAAAGPVFLAVSGDDLSFVTTGAHPSSPTPAGATPAREPADIVVHRLRLR